MEDFHFFLGTALILIASSLCLIVLGMIILDLENKYWRLMKVLIFISTLLTIGGLYQLLVK